MFQITDTPIEQVIPYARNARIIPESAISKVAASLKEYGWRQPIVVDKEGVIVAGHTRLQAAQRLGMKTVPVHVAANLTPGQIKAYRLMDNRSHDETTWDFTALGPEFMDLKGFDIDLSLTGFDDAMIQSLLGAEAGEVLPEEEWKGLPGFDQGDVRAFRSIIVHFSSSEGFAEFLQLLSLTVTDKSKYVWYPPVEPMKVADKNWVSR